MSFSKSSVSSRFNRYICIKLWYVNMQMTYIWLYYGMHNQYGTYPAKYRVKTKRQYSKWIHKLFHGLYKMPIREVSLTHEIVDQITNVCNISDFFVQYQSTSGWTGKCVLFDLSSCPEICWKRTSVCCLYFPKTFLCHKKHILVLSALIMKERTNLFSMCVYTSFRKVYCIANMPGNKSMALL